jgi:hypothetical protein
MRSIERPAFQALTQGGGLECQQTFKHGAVPQYGIKQVRDEY